MLKKLILFIILFTITLNASSFNQRVINIIGSKEFTKNKSLIDYIFAKKSAYYKDGIFNYVSVMQKLKENGLLNVSLSSPQDISITFITSDSPIKAMKIISDSLKKLGYFYYFTKKLTYTKDEVMVWSINLKTEAAIDPLMLSKELAKNNCRFLDIRKEGNKFWEYKIDTSNAVLDKAEKLILGEKIDFKKPLKPYFITFDNANTLSITSKNMNKWFPNIVFYDKKLNILNIVRRDYRTSFYRVNIPKNTKYVKIDDIYTLENIKRGLSVMIK